MKKIFIIVLLFVTVICINSITYGKYVIEETTGIIAKINLDRLRPDTTYVSKTNTNSIDINSANKTHIITTRIKIIEKNIKENNFGLETLTVRVGNIVVDKNNIQIQIDEQKDDYIIYNITLKNLENNGNIRFEIARGTILDRSNNFNLKKFINLSLKIDNISPEYIFEETRLEDGTVMATIKANEEITQVNGWQLSQDRLTLTRVFSENGIYAFKISDLAQNETQVQITITKAIPKS